MGGKSNKDKLISLMICDNLVEANLIKGRLENEGIKSFITNENFSTLMPHYFRMLGSGIHIFIAQNDLDRTQKILSLTEKKSVTSIVCPDCDSQNVSLAFGRGRLRKWGLVILSVLLALPFGNIRKNYFCKDCKCEF